MTVVSNPATPNGVVVYGTVISAVQINITIVNFTGVAYNPGSLTFRATVRQF
ncbi:MAG: hypothetical protein LC793_24845 [Thermomicrobia bacterium]|nr:hypothetical protein [Thermomicrobia bacterium]